ncbi:uncharacterized protein LOC143068063 [Mytilus galloprovincialis]|uniref:uncharacterized protein LOC143068063 n=1 Tax=Mytilus galloprovincialis TaxID=29158 RepID=UPI003F7C9BD1
MIYPIQLTTETILTSEDTTTNESRLSSSSEVSDTQELTTTGFVTTVDVVKTFNTSPFERTITHNDSMSNRIAAVGDVKHIGSTKLPPGTSIASASINISTKECGDGDQVFCRILQYVMNRTITPSTPQTTSPTTNTTTVLTTAETDYISKTLQSYISKTAAVTFPTTTKRVVTFTTTTKTFKPTPVNLVSMTTVSKSTSPSTTTNFLDLLLHVIDKSNLNISLTDIPPTLKTVIDEVNAHNSTNVDIATVNSILTQLDMLTNGTTQFGIPELSNILLNISKWKTSNTATIEKSASVISNLMETVSNNASIATASEETNAMQNILLTMQNIVTSSVTTAVSITSSAVDISTRTVEENITSSFEVFTSGGNIVLSHKLFINRIVRISTVVFQETLGEKLGGSNNFGGAEVSSNVVAVSLEELNNTSPSAIAVNETGAIIITLPTEIRRREKRRICTYWDFNLKGWASDVGVILDKNDTYTTCMFDHLTNFAVLVMYFDDEKEVSINQENILMIMTTIGCSISITCLGMTVVAFAYLKLMCKETILIHGNLSIALLIGQLVMVASNDAIENTVACKVVAMVMHYFFLSSFSWMMVEGIALYLSCTRGLYNQGNKRMKYCAVGWGFPLLIVIVSIGAEFPNYGTGERHSCWLSTDDGLIWAFMGPMLIIIMFNMFVLGLVVKVFLSLQTISTKSETAKIRASIRAMVFLLPLLGITWLLGILVPLHATFHYLFVVGNSLQGMMIFFLHCICNDEIRKKFLEKKKRLSSTQRTFADPDMTVIVKRNKRKNMFSDVQLEIQNAPRDHKYAWVS